MQQQPPSPLRGADIRERICPSCGGTFPSNFGYTDWCDQCEWNLEPRDAPEPGTIIESIYARLGDRMSRGLIAEMLGAESIRPRLTISKIIAYALAGLVHGITLILLITGIVMIATGWPHFLMVAGGILFALCAFAVRPRIVKVPEKILSRERIPALYTLSDDIADALGTSRLAGIIVDTRFNASFFRAGWRQRKYMTIGIPMFATLSAMERVSTIGHEIGHGANGDSTRGLFMGTAIASLLTWQSIIRPQSLHGNARGMAALIMIPVNALLYGVSGIISGVVFLLARLLYRNQQRAEYLADYLSAVVAGREASVTSIDKLHLANIYEFTVQKFVAGSRNPSGLFQELGRQMAMIPEREMERLRRISRMAASRLDMAHPPTPYRVQLLDAKSPIEPRITLSDAEARRIDDEIASFYQGVEQIIVEQRQARMYRMG
ncbi:MAG: M48 family metallopeptidase [Bacteroidota bacterium]